MDLQTQKTLDDILRDCTVALFTSYGVDIAAREEASGPPADVELAGSVGLVSREISGSLLVAANGDVLEAMAPTDGSREAICDWVGELANQLLGRFKNRLLGYGVELAVSTPIVIEGKALHMRGGPRRPLRFFEFSSDRGQILIGIDLKSKVPFELMESSSKACASVEGDVIFF